MDAERKLAFEICLAVGCPHPDYLLQFLAAPQWEEWVQFANEVGWGEQRSDLRNAALWQIIGICMGGLKFDSPLSPAHPYATGGHRMTDEEALVKLRAAKARIAAREAKKHQKPCSGSK